MKDKKIVFYSVYEEKNNDLKLVSQFDCLDDISKHLQVKKVNLKNMISQKKKIKDKYIIYKDYMLSSEI